MSQIVSRTCTEVPDNERDREPSSRPLDAYRAAPAYVLLGDPGAGKTTAFECEREACGADGVLVSARDFLTFDPTNHPERRGKTLFIDGLDEVRAGRSDARVPLDAIRRNLDGLGKPSFRLSCRAADWFGTNDRSNMAAVAPDGSLTVLRLDPLTDSDVGTILAAHPRVPDSGKFIREAREKGVDGFLTNPQSLNMLADVVAGGNWPASRLELFEQACRQMAREHHHGHVAAGRSPDGVPVPTGGSLLAGVLEAAGRLCAIQLVAGTAGYTLISDRESRDFPAFDRCEEEWDSIRASDRGGASRSALLRAALRTKLFRTSSDGRFAPAHRHVAEFLGARYLARLIDGRKHGQGLAARRVLALITGGDGIVVSQLRGLSAWLAARCREARLDLVERDPIGVGLYGDVAEFSTDEKRALLQSLEFQASRLFSASGTATAFAPLAVPAMEPVFRGILTGERLREQPSFAWFVLHILAHGSRLASLASILLDIVRDNTWPPDVNVAALDAFIYNHPDDREKTSELKKLLADIRGDAVADPNDDLLGTLLTELYPQELSPSGIWEYLSSPSNRMRLGRYYLFWRRTLDESCALSQVADHLDGLAKRLEVAGPVLQSLVLREVPVRLLARGLETRGEEIDTVRLYDWLGVGLESSTGEYSKAVDGVGRIRSWLERHPETQKSIFAEGLQRGESEAGPIRVHAYDVWQRLYGSTLPTDFGLWCLDWAEVAPDRRLAAYLLERAFAAVIEQKGDEGLSVDVLIERTRDHPVLAEVFAELSVCRLDAAYFRHRDHVHLAQRERAEDRRRHETWIAHVREHEDALRANRSSPQLLHQIAAGYFGRLPEAGGDSPEARLGSLFRSDERLIEAAFVALRGVRDRTDLPEVKEIISLREKNQEHYLALPLRAGLAEFDRTGEDVLGHLDERQARIALAFRYCDVSQDEPAWYRGLLDSNPGLVADVMIECTMSALRSGREYVSGLHELARSDNHTNVARVASLRILRSFPIRCTTKQLVDLNYLLWSALRHADRSSFGKLIDRKLSRKSMNVAQRARWLAAGFVLSPEARSEAARAFAEKSERRLREFAAFLGDSHDATIWIDRLGTAGLRELVRLMGVSFGPHARSDGVHWVTPAMEASGHVRRMIHRLAELPSDYAGTALGALALEESLGQWRDELVHARDQQRVICRDAAYRHPEVGQVCRTLNDGAPANAGDLAALVRERLDEVALGIRTGNDNGWRPYWNEGKHRRPVEPKYEDSCRDALLRDLRSRLQKMADAQPEGRYANDRRADIRVACGDFHVPVEVKKNNHAEIWSALRNQLMARYTIDPATGGYGIYLVLWFGEAAGWRTPPPPSGSRPDGPEALKARLEEDLTPDEARRIAVCVVDVSAPA